MFDSLKRRREQSKAYRLAFEKGRDAGEAICKAVDGWFTMRIEPIKVNVMEALQYRLDLISESDTNLTERVRIEFEIMFNHWNEQLPKLETELDFDLREWRSPAANLGIIDDLRKMIKAKFADVALFMFSRGTDLAYEALVRLKCAL